MRNIYILIFSIIITQCNNNYNTTNKIVRENKKGLDTCLNSDTLNSTEEYQFLELLQDNGLEYFKFDLKNRYIIRFKSNCINGYNVVFTLVYFEYGDILTAQKKEAFFKSVKMDNLKLKGWNHIEIRRKNKLLIFSLIENQSFIKNWEQHIN
jgi:hypothetical protein